MNNLAVITGARPNFMKVCGILDLLRKCSDFNVYHIHTNQHYENVLANDFFRELGIEPDCILNLDRTSTISRITSIITELSGFIQDKNIKLILIPGDIDSSLASAIACLKSNLKIAHIESGLRSFDWNMPEEQNRVIIDDVSSILFTTEYSGLKNIFLRKDQIVFYVGNTMIDSIIRFGLRIDDSDILEKLEINYNKYILCTFHRPSNVDILKSLEEILINLSKISNFYPVVFPVHPRTNLIIQQNQNLLENCGKILFTNSLGYFDFQKLLKNCRFVITDSGGVQEECAYYQKKCFTYRLNTERPITIYCGSNELIGVNDWQKVTEYAELDSFLMPCDPVDLWDGLSSSRIVEILKTIL